MIEILESSRACGLSWKFDGNRRKCRVRFKKVTRMVSHTCKSCTTPNKNKKLFTGTPTKTKLHVQLKWKKKRSTIFLIYNPCHRLKVTEGCTKNTTKRTMFQRNRP